MRGRKEKKAQGGRERRLVAGVGKEVEKEEEEIRNREVPIILCPVQPKSSRVERSPFALYGFLPVEKVMWM